MKRTVDLRVSLGLIVAALMIGGTGYLFLLATNSATESSERVTHTYSVLSVLNSMYGDVRESESLQRGFLLTADSGYYRQYAAAKASVYSEFGTIRRLTSDNPLQQRNLDNFKIILDARIDSMETGIELRQNGLLSAVSYVSRGGGNRLMQRLDSSVRTIEALERSLLGKRQLVADQSVKSIRRVLVILLSLAILLIILVYFLFRRDISQRGQAERERDRFFEVSPDLFFILGKDQRIERANTAWESVLGWPPSELQNMTMLDIGHPSEKEALASALTNGINADIDYEGQFLCKNDRYIWLELRGRTFREEGTKNEGTTFGNARDITSRRETEAEILSMNDRLLSSNKELESFASVASHDLQEPLRKIQSFADILVTRYSEGISEQAGSYIAKMAQASTRMRLLIDNMLGYSRLTSRPQEIENIDLKESIAGVLNDLEIAIESRNAQVNVGELPTIEADKYQMQQLFQNLIANALKFQKPGAAPVVSIQQRTAVGTGDDPAKDVMIVIADNGIGFDQEYAAKVFGMFQRLHGRNEYEGTGIGLAVCHKIVERHNGTITVQSKVGEGTTFEITLPKKQNRLDQQ